MRAIGTCSPLADEPVIILDCFVLAQERPVHDAHALTTCTVGTEHNHRDPHTVRGPDPTGSATLQLRDRTETTYRLGYRYAYYLKNLFKKKMKATSISFA